MKTEIVRAATEAERVVLAPFIERVKKVEEERAEAWRQLGVVAARLEPELDLDPSAMCFVRQVAEGATPDTEEV